MFMQQVNFALKAVECVISRQFISFLIHRSHNTWHSAYDILHIHSSVFTIIWLTHLSGLHLIFTWRKWCNNQCILERLKRLERHSNPHATGDPDQCSYNYLSIPTDSDLIDPFHLIKLHQMYGIYPPIKSDNLHINKSVIRMAPRYGIWCAQHWK